MKYKSGVVDHSSKYCENLLALFTIRAVLLRQICGFQVFSYMEGFGNLDDIVMIVEYNDRTKKAFVFQLKHKATRRLNKDMLLNMKGDFSLTKYEKSYEEILKNKREPNSILRDIKENDINLIIYTNMLLINDDTDLVKLKLTNDSVYNTFINTSKKINGKVYKIENGRQVKFNPQFIKQLYLYTSQMASDELENGIWQAIAQVFSDIKIESVLSFMQYISDWMYGKLGKPYPLGYKEIEMKLLEILIQPWTILPTISISADNMESSNQWSAWNKAVMVSDLTILSDNESLEFATQAALELLKSSTVWDMYVNRRIFEDLSTNSKIVKKLLLKRKRLKGELSPDHIYMTLWELKQLPLIISCPTKDSLEISIKALKLFSGTIRKFIIVHENCIIDEFEELRRLYRIFNRVTTLPSKVALNILSKIQISLQGKTALSLKGLICDKISCTTFLTPDMILQMNTQTVYIGNRFPDSDFHIQRRFKKIFMSTQVINEHNLIFIVYVKAKAAICITNLLNEKHYMDIDDYLVNMTNSYNHHGLADINVLFLRENQRKYLFSLAKHVYQLNMDKSVCLLEYLEDMDVFKCLDTVGSIKMQDIKKHIVENVEGDEKYSVSESDALNYFESPLQILRGTAGSGKTTTLKYISNNSSPYSWVFYIDLMLQHHEFVRMDPESSDISILMSLLKLETSFSQNVFKMLLEQGKVIFFIDDFDFIQTNVKLKEVVNFLIELCTSYGNKIWISSRTEDVENSINKIAIELELLNEPNQIEFLEKHIGSKYPTEMYKEVVKKMKRNLGTNLSGIIFQWKWLVEILKNKDLRSFIRNDDLIIDIFKEIIELNCNFYPTNKESNKIMMYKLALSVVFQDDILREIIDLDEFLRLKQCFIEDIKTTYKQFIITSFKDDGEPVFVDKLYFEYLIAYWLAQNIKRDTIKHLVNKLFYFELANIKYWFDLILSRDHAVHKAVVTLDLVGLKQIFEDHVGHEMSVLTQSDICGRNALHLAANNGVHFDFMTKQDIVGIKNVNKHCKAFRFDIYTDLSIPEKRDYGKGGCGEQILTFLLQKLPSEDHKILFKTDKVGLSVFDHAYKSGSLFILNELLNYGFYRVLCQDQNVFFLHHCYSNGLFNIIRNASFQCFCSVRVGRKLLADELERSEVVLGCLKKCCESRLCSKINKQDSSHSFDDTKNMDDMKDMHSKFLEVGNKWDSQFHRAAKDCDFLKLQDMISHRLDDEIINTLSPASFTALHTLVCGAEYTNNIENFIQCAELLIDNGIDVNHPDVHNQSVILHAAVRKYKQLVKFMIEKCRDYIDLDNYKQYGGESARKVIIKHKLYENRLPEFKQIFDTKKLILSSIKSNNDTEFFSLIQREDINKYINTGDGKNDDISAYTLLQLCLVKNQQSFATKLIENGADCFKTIQKNKEKPLEYAIKKHNYDLVKLIFEKYEIKDRVSTDLVNHQDMIGRTLLHEATYKCHFDFILKLLENGASLFIQDRQCKIPLDTVHKSILTEHLDNCIDYDSDNDPEFIEIEYKTLIDRKRRKKKVSSVNRDSNLEMLVDERDLEDVDEIHILRALRKTPDLIDLFSHPVIRTLVDLKMNKTIWIYHINLILYSLFWLFLHLYILNPNIIIVSLLFMFTLILSLRELFQFCVSSEKHLYFFQVENVIEVSMLLVTYTILGLEMMADENSHYKYNWLYITAIVLATIDLLFLVGKNYFVHSIMTYRYILAKFVGYIAPFSLLFVTFTFSFYLLLHQDITQSTGNIFFDLFLRLFTALLMFSGELKEEYLWGGHNVITGRITIIFFVFIMTTILANMLLTLLVNDMDAMRHSAMIKQYSDKTKYILQVESFVNYIRRSGTCFSRFLFLLLNNYYFRRRFGLSLFSDSTKIEINLRSEKKLSEGTVRKFRKKVGEIIEINRTKEHQKMRDLKRLIDKIVSSPNFFYREA